jgi:mannosyltransferase OCH1-like enzyme
MIPKLIHQIFIADGPEPIHLDDETLANTKSWKQCYPNYKYKLWNLQEIRALAQEFDSRVLSAIDVCAFPAMKADMARLMILFLHGGVYADLKLRCMADFIDAFRDCKLVLVEHFDIHEVSHQRDKYLTNSFFIADTRHEFIRRALADCVRNVEARIGTGVWNTTGAKVLMRLQDEFLPESYGRFENGVGVIRKSEAYGKLFAICGGGYNKTGRHWHEREKLESIYTDCDVRYFWTFSQA